MLESNKLELRRSAIRQDLGNIAQLEGDAYTEEVKAKEISLQNEFTGLEQRHRSALIAEDKDLETRKAEAGDNLDAEQRERIELRSKAKLSNYLDTAARGRSLDGAEAELAAAAGVQGIPIELWEPAPKPAEQRAATEAPSTVGVNLDNIRPAVFANSIAARLGCAMPRVASGTYASATINQSLTAGPKEKGADADATAATFTVTSVTPAPYHRQNEHPDRGRGCHRNREFREHPPGEPGACPER